MFSRGSRTAVAAVATAAVLAAGLGLTAAGSTDSSQADRGKQSSAAPRGADGDRAKRSAGREAVTAGAKAADPVDVARSWLDANRSAAAGHGSTDFEVERVTSGVAKGQSLVRLGQRVDGLPVIAGEAVVAVGPSGRVVATNVEASPIGSRPGPQGIDAGTAARIAIGATAAASRDGRWLGQGARAAAEAARSGRSTPRGWSAGDPVLSIYDPRLIGDPRSGSNRLVWRVQVDGGRTGMVRRDVFVDAGDGTLVNSISMVAAALVRKVCDAENTGSSVPCVSPFRTEGENATGISDVDRAYDYAGDTWQMYKDLGRDSLDGMGMPILSTVRYCGYDSNNVYQCPYQNAFWDGDQMVYGAGYAGADDVVAHELTHGVTEYSSNLFYYFQSGAINEGISDVFGEFMDLTNGEGTDTSTVRWKMGEDLPGGAIRNMANPPSVGDPDRTGSPLYDADPNFADDGGVHANSGVVGKAASLMTDGGTFNGQSITGIGLAKAMSIWYQASQLLTSGSDFRDLGNALAQSCQSLVGTSGIVTGDCDQVVKSALATQLNVTPVNAPTTEAPVCQTGTPTNTWSDSFESGPGPSSGWRRTATVGSIRWYWASERPQSALYAKDGKMNLWANDTDIIGDTTMEMNTSVTVPAGGFFRFEHSFDFEVSDGLTPDGGILEYSTNDGVSWQDAGPLMTAGGYTGTIYDGTDASNPVPGHPAFVGNSRGYSSTRLDLGSLDGRSVRFRFRLVTDDGNMNTKYNGWHIDRLRLYSCGPPVPSVSSFSLSQPARTAAVTPTNAMTADYTVSFSEPVSGLSAGDFAIGGTSSGWAVTGVSGSGAGPYTVTLSGPSSGEGTLTLSVRASSVLNAGSLAGPALASPAADQLLIDRTAPTTGFASAPGSWLRSTTARLGFSGADGGAGIAFYECTLGVFTGGVSGPRSPADRCSNPRTFTSLGQGLQTAFVRAVDAAGNVDATPARTTFTVDTVAPNTVLLSGPSAGSRPSFSFTSRNSDVSRFQCRFDYGSWVTCSSPYRRSTSLSRGTHSFSVRAIDRAGNVDASPAVKSFRIY